MKMLVSIAALSLLSATPALAADPLPRVEPTPAASPSAVAPSVSAPAARPTRYCVIPDLVTGTRLRQKICQTREKWLQQGFDPLAR